MPRSRTRGRVARPDETAPAETGSDDDDDEAEAETQDSPDQGTIDDLLDDQTGAVEQQVLSGSQADLRIAPEVNPGFIDTEVVNRMGLVLSLNLEFDPSRQQWVPAVVDKTERQAVEQTLSEDRATEDLTGSVDTDDSTQVNSDGDLELTGKQEGSSTISDAPKVGEDTFSSTTIYLTPDDNYDAITVSWDISPNGDLPVYVRRESDSSRVNEVPFESGEQSIPGPYEAGVDYAIGPQDNTDQFTAGVYDTGGPPLSTAVGEIYDYNPDGGSSSSGLVGFTDVGIQPPAESGEATSSFDNPCAASSTRSAQHDVCSKTSDVTVDLYNGDPSSPDSTLLARNIDQREDISDLPDAFTDLQYRLTLRRDENGETPKVSRLGHQIIK